MVRHALKQKHTVFLRGNVSCNISCVDISEAVAAVSRRKPSIQGYSYLLNKYNCKLPFLNLREVLEAGRGAQMSGKSGGGKEDEKSSLMPD